MKQQKQEQYRVSERLLRGTSGEERDKLRANIVHTKWLLDNLKGLVESDLKASTTKMRSSDGYEQASWPYAQADHLGYQRALAKVLGYLTLDREEKP